MSSAHSPNRISDAPTSGAASWNPAHRPDSDTRDDRTTSTIDVDSFDQLAEPGAEGAQLCRRAHEGADQAIPETGGKRQSISVETQIDQTTGALAPEQLAHLASDFADVEGPANCAGMEAKQNSDDNSSAPGTVIEEIVGGEEAPADPIEETAPEQEQERKHHMYVLPGQPLHNSSSGMTKPLAHDVEIENELAKYREQGEAYEHQGDLTQMEEAVDEAPTAPLLDDEEALPTVEEVQMKRAPTMQARQDDTLLEDFDSAPAFRTSLPKGKAMLGQIDRSFTTNFTEIPVAEKEQEHEEDRADSSDWPSAGDDKTFGELLDSEQSSSTHLRGFSVDPVSKPESDPWGTTDDEDMFGELLGSGQPQTSAELSVAQPEETSFLEAPVPAPKDTTEDDLAAAFASVLLDDDLLEDPKDMDMSAIFGDDDPGFLSDELLAETPPVSAPAPILPPAESGLGLQRGQSPYVPVAAQQGAPHPKSYGASGAQFSVQNHGRSSGTPATGLYDVYGHGAGQQQASERPAARTAQSFVDKTKGGYQSPYDLPMEVVKPKQRPRQAALQNQSAPVAPPRTSSMSSQLGQQPVQRPPTNASTGFTPPVSASPVPPSPTMNGVVPQKAPTRQSSGFFEDLPIVPKARARPSGAYTPQLQSNATAPPVQPPQNPQGLPTPVQQPTYGGFTQPERLPLLPDQPTATTPSQTPSAPPTNQRYSPNTLPAPSQTQNRFSPAPPSQAPPATGARYSPAPPAQAAAKRYGPAPAAMPGHPAVQGAHAFAPRTSSPLAFHGRPQQIEPADPSRGPSSPPKSNGRSSPAIMSPQLSGSMNYSPSASRAPSLSNLASPPQRPMTQSPPTQMKASKHAAQAPTEMPSSTVAPASAPSQKRAFLAHRRKFSRDLSFVPPLDEHAQDPLQRWKGHPIFRWGESGVVISSLPKQTPFYASGQGGPSIKCTPGSITVQPATTFLPLDELSARFPGPLPTKSKKKKEVLGWMSSKIDSLHHQVEAVRMDFDMEPDLKKRIDEKLTLWRIMKIFVEHDGKLEGDRKIEEDVRAVLLPNLAQLSQATELQSPITSSGAGLQADPVDRVVIMQLRQALLEGQRERAVLLAEEKKLWGHAMLIASTMGPEHWQQIVQSFVRSQVKTVGSDARSLAALYQVFANNADECVDELVPPSARAGFQMMSKTEGAVARNPLEGLDQWQETLGLIASNRTPADGNSLLALGKLLGSYGRAEAAHTCFLFARVLAKHTGADDPDATFVLLGANHRRQDESFGNDLDSIMLTEIYEWATSFSQQRAEYTPHLQAFKLKHAQELAAAGLRNQAQAYCDHITKGYQSTTKPSQYYHPIFTQAVADLSAFLSQAPHTGPQSLLSKVSSAKVSSSASSWFTKFVSGDDDQAPNASGAGSDTTGPFGGVNGGSPVISHAVSSSDMNQMYKPMMGGAVPAYSQPGVTALTQQFQPSSAPLQQFQPSSAPGNSRYAPGASGGNNYAPTSAGSYSSNEQRPGTSSSRSYAPSPQPLAVPRPEVNKAASDYGIPYGNDSRRGSAQFSSGSYEPRVLLGEQPTSHPYLPHVHQQHEESPALAPQASFDHASNGVSQQEESLPDADGGSYEPAATSSYDAGYGYGYEPPAYVPYEPEPEAEEAEDKPKPRRGVMDDDDDDILARAATLTKSSPAPSASMSKSEADRIAEEAFRKAAEADAARDGQKKSGEKKGWGIGLGGWFGGKKGEQGMPQQQQSGPIKAKLGEQNSFYFDKDLGKWVNKKDPKGAESAAATTPPPPKGPPSRNVSAMGPPSGPPSRVSSGSGMPPPRIPTTPSISGSGPPSRVGTPAGGSESGMPSTLTNPALSVLNRSGSLNRSSPSLSNASSIDDLLGGTPGPRKGGAVKKSKKGGRYVDVMAAT